jgi:hypothetical protein
VRDFWQRQPEGIAQEPFNSLLALRSFAIWGGDGRFSKAKYDQQNFQFLSLSKLNMREQEIRL